MIGYQQPAKVFSDQARSLKQIAKELTRRVMREDQLPAVLKAVEDELIARITEDRAIQAYSEVKSIMASRDFQLSLADRLRAAGILER